jgi:GTPase SAR1 family protein
MTSAFYGKAQGAIVVFDVSDASSFEHLTQWIKDIKQHAPEGCAIIICANKVDLPAERWAVSKAQIAEFGETVGYPVVETSASSGQNVNEVSIFLRCIFSSLCSET